MMPSPAVACFPFALPLEAPPPAPQPTHDAAALYDRLVAAGFTLSAQGDTLRVRRPPGAELAPDLRAAIAAAKPALLALLTRAAHPCVGCGRHAFRDPGTACVWCRRGRAQPMAAGDRAAGHDTTTRAPGALGHE